MLCFPALAVPCEGQNGVCRASFDYALEALAKSSSSAMPTSKYQSPMRSWEQTLCGSKAVSRGRLDACLALVNNGMVSSNRPCSGWTTIQKQW